jgi:hypothetical protein
VGICVFCAVAPRHDRHQALHRPDLAGLICLILYSINFELSADGRIRICGGTALSFPTPANEAKRLNALRSFDILDTAPEIAYDEIVELAAQVCGCAVRLHQFYRQRSAVDEGVVRFGGCAC